MSGAQTQEEFAKDLTESILKEVRLVSGPVEESVGSSSQLDNLSYRQQTSFNTKLIHLAQDSEVRSICVSDFYYLKRNV